MSFIFCLLRRGREHLGQSERGLEMYSLSTFVVMARSMNVRLAFSLIIIAMILNKLVYFYLPWLLKKEDFIVGNIWFGDLGATSRIKCQANSQWNPQQDHFLKDRFKCLILQVVKLNLYLGVGTDGRGPLCKNIIRAPWCPKSHHIALPNVFLTKSTIKCEL